MSDERVKVLRSFFSLLHSRTNHKSFGRYVNDLGGKVFREEYPGSGCRPYHGQGGEEWKNG